MRSYDARDLLLAIASALRERPPSFSFDFAGTLAAAGGTPDPATLQITQKALDAQLHDKVTKAAHDIAFIASEIMRDQPDRGLIERTIEGLPEEVVGSVVPTLVSAILAACT